MLVLANKQFPDTPSAKIGLGNDKYAIISPSWYANLMHYHWFAKKSFYRYYAVRTTHVNGRKIFLRMHRVIARTPPDMVCHHVNRNTLDNRESNLLNMNPYDHKILHSWR